MRKLRMILLAGLTVFAFAAIASAASAHEFKVEGGSGAGTKLALNDYAGAYVLTGTPFGVAVHIECTKVKVLSGELKALGADSENLEFHACAVSKPANCTLAKADTSGPTKLVGTGLVEDEFQGEGANSTFTTITLEGGSCSLAAKPFEVTGTQTCKLPEAGTEKVGHTVECATTGSVLKAGGKKAEFSGTVAGLEVEGGKKWSAS